MSEEELKQISDGIFNKLDEKEKVFLATVHDVKNKEIERLNRIISQREKKWEKWTTEKTILSTKMSDYLCKYQNIKREYTKQIKISTDRKKEIERLNNIINKIDEYVIKLRYYSDEDEQGYRISKDIHNILQELKGSDKE